MGSFPLNWARDGDDALYLLSRKDSPRGKVLRLPMTDLDACKGAGDRSRKLRIEFGTTTTGPPSIASSPRPADCMCATWLGGPSRVRIFDHQGHMTSALCPLPPISAVSGIVHTEGDNVLYAGFHLCGAFCLVPLSMQRPGSPHVPPCSRLRQSSSMMPRWCASSLISKDGTRVPINIIQRKRPAARWQQSHAARRLRRLRRST